ncbi:MAG: hypothetical protein KDC57_22910 [Saprospiraceae bacterium]|nr:hypothetical protein [Saprospiraceae bacterium]
MNRLYFPALALLLLFSQCSKSEDPTPADACDGLTPTYQDDIQPIIAKSCALAGCHIGDVPQPKYTSYAAVKALTGTIQQRVTEKSMPPAGATPLSASEIKLIDCWIKNGAPEN